MHAKRRPRKGTKIGTTGRGIGPAYEDKVGRRSVRVADLADLQTLEARVDRALQHHNPLRKGLGIDAIDRDALIAQLIEIAPRNSAICGARLASAQRAKNKAASGFCLRVRRARFWISTLGHIRL